jgi:hypothetical protein
VLCYSLQSSPNHNHLKYIDFDIFAPQAPQSLNPAGIRRDLVMPTQG